MEKMTEARLAWLWAVTTATRIKANRPRDQRGEIAQTVIIVAILAAAAIAIATIIASKFKDKAAGIPTE